MSTSPLSDIFMYCLLFCLLV